MGRSIFAQLLATNVLIIFASLAVLGLIVTPLLHSYFYDSRKDGLIRQGEALAGLLSSEINNPKELDKIVNEMNTIDPPLGTSTLVIDTSGKIIAPAGHTLKHHLNNQELSSVMSGNVVVCQAGFTELKDQIIIMTPLRDDSGVKGAVVVYSPIRGIENITFQVIKALLYGGFGAVLLAGLLGFVLTKQISHPLRLMSQAALSMSTGNFNTRLAVNSSQEVNTLAQALNHLSARLSLTLEHLQQEQSKLQAIISGIRDGLVAVDSNQRAILVNAPAADWLGVPHNKPRDPLLPPVLEGMLGRAIDGSNCTGELHLAGKPIQVRVSPVYSGDDVIGAVALLQDQTDALHVEQLRRQFVSQVSHELKTPLTLIRGYVQALLDGMDKLPGTKEKYLNIIHKETDRLNRIVSDLLDLAQIESGKVPMRFEPVRLAELLNDLTIRYDSVVCLNYHEDKLNLIVNVDKDRMLQVLINLIQNALEFSPPGSPVEVGIEQQQDMVRVWVRDEGSGIKPEHLNNIWNRFYKVAQGAGNGGSGLGLSIVKEIIERHGGRVDVQSVPGKGSCFSVLIPLA